MLYMVKLDSLVPFLRPLDDMDKLQIFCLDATTHFNDNQEYPWNEIL